MNAVDAGKASGAAPADLSAVRRPSLALFGSEPARAALEWLGHVCSTPATGDIGDGHPVVIFPGLCGGAASLSTLLRHCRRLGYDAMDWGQGINRGPDGDFDVWLRALAERIAALTAAHPQKVSLVGWSLGGLYARELAKLMTPRIRQVITIATPFNADADYTRTGPLFRTLNGSSGTMSAEMYQRLREPPPLPTTSIYSRTDGVVAWQTCCHTAPGRLVQDIEVHGSHLGMGWNAEVLQVLNSQLGQTQTATRPKRAHPPLPASTALKLVATRTATRNRMKP